MTAWVPPPAVWWGFLYSGEGRRVCPGMSSECTTRLKTLCPHVKYTKLAKLYIHIHDIENVKKMMFSLIYIPWLHYVPNQQLQLRAQRHWPCKVGRVWFQKNEPIGNPHVGRNGDGMQIWQIEMLHPQLKSMIHPSHGQQTVPGKGGVDKCYKWTFQAWPLYVMTAAATNSAHSHSSSYECNLA